MSTFNWKDAAIAVIGAVDYDIEKECQIQLEDEGECEMVAEVISTLKRYFTPKTGG